MRSKPLLRLAGLGALAALPLLATGCAAASVALPAYRATPGKPDARVGVQTTPVEAVFTVRSPSGIGSAKVEQVGGPKPARVLLRLHLAGLEELRFTYAGTEVKVGVSSSGTHDVVETAVVGGSSQDIGPGSPYWMEVRLVAADGGEGSIPLAAGGYFEVSAPASFIESEARDFSLAWIDFYR